MRNGFSKIFTGSESRIVYAPPVPRETVEMLHHLTHEYGFRSGASHTRGGLCYWLAVQARQGMILRAEVKGEFPFDGSHLDRVANMMARNAAILEWRTHVAYELGGWGMRRHVIEPDQFASPGYLEAFDGYSTKRRAFARYLHACLDLYLGGATDEEIHAWVP